MHGTHAQMQNTRKCITHTRRPQQLESFSAKPAVGGAAGRIDEKTIDAQGQPDR